MTGSICLAATMSINQDLRLFAALRILPFAFPKLKVKIILNCFAAGFSDYYAALCEVLGL